MKRILYTALFLICLLAPVILPAEQSPADSEEMTEIEVLLNQYKEAGYKVLGPIQYLGKTSSSIEVYRHGKVSYNELDIIDKHGEKAFLKKNDIVYVLSKKGQVILIHLDMEEQNNA